MSARPSSWQFRFNGATVFEPWKGHSLQALTRQSHPRRLSSGLTSAAVSVAAPGFC